MAGSGSKKKKKKKKERERETERQREKWGLILMDLAHLLSNTVTYASAISYIFYYRNYLFLLILGTDWTEICDIQSTVSLLDRGE